MTQQKDQIYTQHDGKPGSFKFDARVAKVFEDMISRSVPGYQQILHMLPTLTRQCLFTNHHYYDLGCSLGAGMLAMTQGIGQMPHKLIGVDNSSAMIEQANQNLKGIPCELIEQDILTTELKQAALVLMNFTLQFIAIDKRANLVANIYQSLCPGGALVLSEKLKFDDTRTNQALIDIHHQFKADQGYSQLEISHKRDAIENVLIPETLSAHTERLKNAGFEVVTPWIQNLQFVSILAVK